MIPKKRVLACCILALVLMGMLVLRLAENEPAKGPIWLRDVSRETGVDFTHTDGSSGNRYIVEAISAGLALFDYDNDGLVDIYFVNGAPHPGDEVELPPGNALYRNNGDWTFTDVTEQTGVGDTGFGLGVTVGDYDNDGDADLYVNNFGPNVLYRNNADGTFTDVTARAGVHNGDRVGAGACFLDMDADGDLDLYVGNYIDFRYDLHVQRTHNGFPIYPHPRDYSPVPDTVYRNNGDGTFTDCSRESGVGLHAGTSMGMVCADYDRDGDTDVFVLNDVGANFLFQNDGTGKFEEVGTYIGAAYNFYGHENASMGVACADCDNDGYLDFFMTSYAGELPVLYRNTGSGLFEDVTLKTGAGNGSLAYVNWGPGFADLDNDGDRDIFIGQGHLEDNVELYEDSTKYRVPNTVMMNTGDGSFLEVSGQCGDGTLPVFSSRGTALDDLDNDGDIDVAILNSREHPTILRNETGNSNHWLQIRLQGVNSNRDGVGAQVTLVAGDLTQVDEVHAGRGYQSYWGSRLHFGLGQRRHVDRIEVRWIGGGVEIFKNLQVDQLLILKEGTGEPGG